MASLVRFGYIVLLYLLLPLVVLVLYWPKRGKPGFGKRWREHFGISAPLAAEQPLWVHAVSVGEVMAASALIRALKAAHPQLTVLLTTTTLTGANEASRLGDLVCHRFAPLDYPDTLQRFLNRMRPRALLIMETELWPNLLAACRSREIPVMLVNARLSASSCRGYQRVHWLMDGVWSALDRVLCQHRNDAERFLQLGLAPDRVAVTGSVKFDVSYPDHVISDGLALRQSLGAQRPVWIAGSTHQGEEEQLLEAFAQLRESVPNAALILVPRHPERFARVYSLCSQAGYQVCRRSESPADAQLAAVDIYLGDTMGELPMMIVAADVAFIGGSLIPRGGHNVLEAAALSRPVIVGEHVFNFAAITDALVARGGACVVHSAAELAATLQQQFADDELRARMGALGAQLVEENRGALARTLAEVSAAVGLADAPSGTDSH